MILGCAIIPGNAPPPANSPVPRVFRVIKMFPLRAKLPRTSIRNAFPTDSGENFERKMLLLQQIAEESTGKTGSNASSGVVRYPRSSVFVWAMGNVSHAPHF